MRQAMIVGGDQETATQNLPYYLKHVAHPRYDEVCQVLLGSSTAQVEECINPGADTTVFVFDAGTESEDLCRQLNAEGITAHLFNSLQGIERLVSPTGSPGGGADASYLERHPPAWPEASTQ